MKKQIHMYLNFVDSKLGLFRDFLVFVLSPIPKNENLEITERKLKYENAVSKTIEIMFKWHQIHKYSLTLFKLSLTLFVLAG